MWATGDEDLGAALSDLWPELQRGYAMLPERTGGAGQGAGTGQGPGTRLPKWSPSFLAIPDAGSRSPSRMTSGAASPFFASEDQYIGLI